MTKRRDDDEPDVRDILAAIAMHALLARDTSAMLTEVVARHAYEQADAMLAQKEREK
jgi:hypothetical protein